MEAPHTAVSAFFNQFNLDESMSNIGTMAPYAGYGLGASFVVKTYPEQQILMDCLDFQCVY